MKLFTLFTFVSFIYLASACGQTNQGGAYQQNPNYSNTQNATNFSNTSNTSNMQAIKDPQTGMISTYVPFPASWQQTDKGFRTPDGSTTESFKIDTYNQTPNWLSSVQAVLEQRIYPLLNQIGARVTNTYRVQEIVEGDRQRDKLYWKSVQGQYSFDAIAIEADYQGKKTIAVIHFTLIQSQIGNASVCYGDQLTTEPQNFERDKKIFLNGLANMQMNPQWVAMQNQKDQQRTQTAWNAHNNKMRENQNHFNTMNQIHNDTYNTLNNISMETYRNNSNASDRMQDMTVNGIWEQQNMQNPYSGQTIKVESGYKYYYINSNNQYIGTNDAFYNPNTDPNMNNVEWKKMPTEKKSDY
ncbi:hypothetical protein [Chondrinema litorale]|uniref:hypothetical protein n=1 Tax=Chondrinema litorale TaxID=2994555 RepID=UPI002542A0A1|nr:hypothetical protein [Chondrinema litorale]UZR96614.1 hypothetical protein OQ292_20920 [Chondrinema litorale]